MSPLLNSVSELPTVISNQRLLYEFEINLPNRIVDIATAGGGGFWCFIRQFLDRGPDSI